MTPGPIGINSATYVGTRIAGLPGAIVATLVCVFPSCIIVLNLAYVYYKYRGLATVQGILNGQRPAVIAMIASAGLALVILAFWNGKVISLENFDYIAVTIFLSFDKMC